MVKQEQIEYTLFCSYHQVDHSFINALAENGLIKLNVIDQQKYIPQTELGSLEQMIRLHRELDINVEGIEAIIHVLQRLDKLQQENVSLKNKLRFYSTTN